MNAEMRKNEKKIFRKRFFQANQQSSFQGNHGKRKKRSINVMKTEAVRSHFVPDYHNTKPQNNFPKIYQQRKRKKDK